MAGIQAAAAEQLIQKLKEWKEDKKRPLVLVVFGRGGAGKSTLINNLLELKKGDEQHCSEGKLASAETRVVDFRIKTKGDVEVHIADTPGLGAGIDGIDPKKVIAELSKKTDKKADFLFYCISLHPGAKPDHTDVKIVKLLTAAYGEKIWERTFLVLTFANQCEAREEDSDSDDEAKINNYNRKIKSYADKFSSILQAANVKVPVIAILPTPAQPTASTTANSTTAQNGSSRTTQADLEAGPAQATPDGNYIPAIPVGGKKLILDLPFKHNWSDRLFLEVLKKASDPHTLSNLLELKGFKITLDDVAGVFGGTVGGGAIGGAVGGTLGAGVGLGFGVIIGAPLGAAAGGVSGAILAIAKTKLQTFQATNF